MGVLTRRRAAQGSSVEAPPRGTDASASPPAFQMEEGEWQGSGGFKLFMLSAEPLPPQRPRGVLVFMHGLSDHVTRHLPVLAPAMLAAGFAVTGYDMPGHGHSGPHLPHMRNFVRAFHLLVADLVAFLQGPVKQRFEGLPIFLMGHSMGGAVAALAACQLPRGFLAGVALSSPLVAVQPLPRAWSAWALATAVAAINWLPGAAHVRIVGRRPLEAGMRCERGIAESHADTLWDRSPYMLGTIAALLDATDRVQRSVPRRLVGPLYVQQGTEDVATPHPPLRMLLARIANARAAQSAADASARSGSGSDGRTGASGRPERSRSWWWRGTDAAVVADAATAVAAGPDGPELDVEALARLDIVYHEVAGGFHDLNHDHETEECLARLVAWMLAKCGGGGRPLV